MTTQQAIEALHALPRMGQGAPGLARMQNLCDHLGNPEKELQCIHIAGTNGKGSLAAMTSSILTAAGYKTGLTISPYVVDFRERFQTATVQKAAADDEDRKSTRLNSSHITRSRMPSSA